MSTGCNWLPLKGIKLVFLLPERTSVLCDIKDQRYLRIMRKPKNRKHHIRSGPLDIPLALPQRLYQNWSLTQTHIIVLNEKSYRGKIESCFDHCPGEVEITYLWHEWLRFTLGFQTSAWSRDPTPWTSHPAQPFWPGDPQRITRNPSTLSTILKFVPHSNLYYSSNDFHPCYLQERLKLIICNFNN